MVEGETVVKNSQIHDNNVGGIVFDNNSKGNVENCNIFVNPIGILINKAKATIEDCEIFANVVGLFITGGSDPVVTNGKINRHKSVALIASENAKVTVKNCDLTNNDHSSWDIDNSSLVTRRTSLIKLKFDAGKLNKPEKISPLLQSTPNFQ